MIEVHMIYSGLTLNQDKARQRRTGLKLSHYNSIPIQIYFTKGRLKISIPYTITRFYTIIDTVFIKASIFQTTPTTGENHVQNHHPH